MYFNGSCNLSVWGPILPEEVKLLISKVIYSTHNLPGGQSVDTLSLHHHSALDPAHDNYHCLITKF